MPSSEGTPAGLHGGSAGAGRRRIPLAAGVSVTRKDDGGAIVEAPFGWPGWTPRREPRAGSAAHPGTAVRWEDDWYEVLEIQESGGGGIRVHLGRWDPSHTMRRPVELTAESCRRALRGVEQEERRRRAATALALLGPLAGFLPAPVQRRMELEWGHRAERATAISALIVLGLATTGILSAWAWKAGLAFDGLSEAVAKWCYRGLPLLIYFTVESVLRTYCGFSGIVVGSLLGLPFGWLFRGRPAGSSASPGTAPLATPRSRNRKAAEIDPERDRDEVRKGREEGIDLEIVSLLPKETWRPGFTGIEVAGELHALEAVDRETGPDGRPRHVFRLRLASDADLFKAWAEHRPEEVGEIWREARRREAATFVETWAHLWGLLDEPTQLALGRGYDYDPWLRTRATIVVEAVVGVAHLVLGLGGILEKGSGASGLVLALGVFLVWEALVRWGRYRSGNLHPSVVGALLAPLVRNAVRWAPPEGAPPATDGDR